MLEQILDALNETLTDMVISIFNFIPLFIIGLLILLIGYVIARVLRTAITRGGQRVGLDSVLERAGMTSQLASAGIEQSPSALIGTIFYYLVFLNFLLAALDRMGLQDAVMPLKRLIDFLPTAIAGLVTFVIGFMLAQFIGKTVSGALQSAGIDFHQTLGGVAQFLVSSMVVVVVMEQIGLQASMLTTILSATVIVIIGGLALAFGLGGQGVTRNVLAGFYARELFATGDILIIDGQEGSLEAIGTLNSEIRMGGEHLIIPNSRLTEGNIRKRE